MMSFLYFRHCKTFATRDAMHAIVHSQNNTLLFSSVHCHCFLHKQGTTLLLRNVVPCLLINLSTNIYFVKLLRVLAAAFVDFSLPQPTYLLVVSTLAKCSSDVTRNGFSWSNQRSYSTSSPVSTEMGDLLQASTVLVCNQPLRPT